MNLFRWLLQITLLSLIVFFGYHYFTKEELKTCISVPIASIKTKNNQIALKEEEINHLLTNLNQQWQKMAQQGKKVLGVFQLAEASPASNLTQQIIDKSQYLYCQELIKKVEQNELITK